MAKSICKPLPETRLALEELLDEAHWKYDIEYNGYLSNHVAHAICSMYSLGATAAQIKSYYDMYVERLVPLRKPKFTISETDWTSFIGNIDAYPELLQFFDKEVDTLGIEKCVNKYVPRLIPGLHAAAFHPLIHIGYGIEYNLPKVLSEGLSYACKEYKPSGEFIDRLPNTESEAASLIQIILDFKGSEAAAEVHSDDNRFNYDVLLVKQEEAIKNLLLKWKCEDEKEQAVCLEELTRASILVFFGSYRQKTLDFFLGHGVTGVHAVTVILEQLPVPERTRLLRIFAVAFLGTYWHQWLPEFSEDVIYAYGEKNSKNIDWEDILAKALICPEEHVIKVVRALLVIKESDDMEKSSEFHKLLDISAGMIVDTIKEVDDYNESGIGLLK